jgi:hypothetical protein
LLLLGEGASFRNVARLINATDARRRSATLRSPTPIPAERTLRASGGMAATTAKHHRPLLRGTRCGSTEIVIQAYTLSDLRLQRGVIPKYNRPRQRLPFGFCFRFVGAGAYLLFRAADVIERRCEPRSGGLLRSTRVLRIGARGCPLLHGLPDICGIIVHLGRYFLHGVATARLSN